MHKIPKDVYNELANDLFVRINILYLIVTDYANKYFKLAQLSNTSSDTVIIHVRSIFAQHGITKVVFSDNRPKYSSHKFKTFFKHGTSYKGLLVPSSLRVTGFGRELFRTIRKPYENARKMIVTYT